MNGPIKVGDLVAVVKPTLCCGNTAAVGVIFTVAGMGDHSSCSYCHANARGLFALHSNGLWLYNTARLQRINPPDRDTVISSTRELSTT